MGGKQTSRLSSPDFHEPSDSKVSIKDTVIEVEDETTSRHAFPPLSRGHRSIIGEDDVEGGRDQTNDSTEGDGDISSNRRNKSASNIDLKDDTSILGTSAEKNSNGGVIQKSIESAMGHPEPTQTLFETLLTHKDSPANTEDQDVRKKTTSAKSSIRKVPSSPSPQDKIEVDTNEDREEGSANGPHKRQTVGVSTPCSDDNLTRVDTSDTVGIPSPKRLQNIVGDPDRGKSVSGTVNDNTAPEGILQDDFDYTLNRMKEDNINTSLDDDVMDTLLNPDLLPGYRSIDSRHQVCTTPSEIDTGFHESAGRATTDTLDMYKPEAGQHQHNAVPTPAHRDDYGGYRGDSRLGGYRPGTDGAYQPAVHIKPRDVYPSSYGGNATKPLMPPATASTVFSMESAIINPARIYTSQATADYPEQTPKEEETPPKGHVKKRRRKKSKVKAKSGSKDAGSHPKKDKRKKGKK